MNRLRWWVLGALALSPMAVSSPVRSNRAWPWFMLVRGGGLEKPVIITRPVSLSSGPALDRRLSAIPGDIVALYASLTPGVPSDYATRRHYEVAEFWDRPGWPFPAEPRPNR